MEENLHRKLAEKLRHEDDYPGFTNEGWLSLETRLERFDRRRRLWGWLLYGLPLAALFGLNLYLLLRPTGSVNSASSPSVEKHTTYLFDTIVNKVTVYEYDTVYRTIHKNFYTSSIAPLPNGFQQKTGVSAGNEGTASTTGGASAAASLLNVEGSSSQLNGATGTTGIDEATGTGVNITTNAATSAWLPWDSAFAVPNASLLPLDFFSKPILATKTTGQHQVTRRLPLVRRVETGFSAGIVLSQKTGTNASPGKRYALENEITLGQDNWSFWQSVAWQRLKLKSREKSAIPGFPLPPSPVPDTYLEKVLYDREDLMAHLGLSYHFEPVKKIQPILGLGIGGNYRLRGEQLTDYEDNNDDEHYELTTSFESGWSGFSGQARAGLGWQFHRLLQFRLQASYTRMLGQSLAEGNIDQWLGLNATLFYRWR